MQCCVRKAISICAYFFFIYLHHDYHRYAWYLKIQNAIIIYTTKTYDAWFIIEQSRREERRGGVYKHDRFKTHTKAWKETNERTQKGVLSWCITIESSKLISCSWTPNSLARLKRRRGNGLLRGSGWRRLGLWGGKRRAKMVRWRWMRRETNHVLVRRRRSSLWWAHGVLENRGWYTSTGERDASVAVWRRDTGWRG